MKTILSVLASAFVSLCVAACGNTGDATATADTTDAAPADTGTPAPDTAPAPDPHCDKDQACTPVGGWCGNPADGFLCCGADSKWHTYGTCATPGPDAGPPPDVATPVDTGTPPAGGGYSIKACRNPGDAVKDLTISHWGEDSSVPSSLSSCSKTVPGGGVDCLTCTLWVTAGKNADFNSEFVFTHDILPDPAATVPATVTWGCHIDMAGGPFRFYGTLTGTKPDGVTACVWTTVDNGVGGCNYRCN